MHLHYQWGLQTSFCDEGLYKQTWGAVTDPSTHCSVWLCTVMGTESIVMSVLLIMVRSRVFSSGDGRPRPHLYLLQRRGPSPGLESLLLGESALQRIYLDGGNNTHLITWKTHGDHSVVKPPLCTECAWGIKGRHCQTHFIHWGPFSPNTRKGALIFG